MEATTDHAAQEMQVTPGGLPPGRNPTAHRLVLLALLVPLIGLGMVFWLLLPGGVAGLAYSPSQFNQVAQVQTQDWRSREISIRGYATRLCVPASTLADCGQWVLLDHRSRSPVTAHQAVALGALLILPQQESGIHALLRRFIPGLARPFPANVAAGMLVTITGSLAQPRTAVGVASFAPKGL